jgi:HK97 family phage portal protein
MGLFAGRPVVTPRGREERMLTFISPPVGAYTQALQDWSSGDPEGAMRQATVWACANRIALSLAMLTPSAFRGPALGTGQAIRLQAPQMLVQPSSDMMMFGWTYSAWISLLLRGNVYGLIVERDRKLGYPTQVELQHPDQVKVRRLEDGTYEYRIRNEVVDPNTIWHRAINRMPGSKVGMSTIQYAARTTRTVQAAEAFGLQWFQDGGHPSGILQNSEAKMINQKDAVTVKERFLAAVHGSREPVVLSQGWDYKPIQIAPNESQFIETMKYSASDICRFFLIQPELVGAASDGSAVTYANVEQRSMDYLTHTISPRMIEWEGWLGQDFLPAGQYVKCDTSPLLRTNMLDRWKAYHMMIGSRAMTQDEVRAMEDLPPMTDAQRAEIDAMPPVPPIPAPAMGS